jgi:RNA polymerase sigma factor (sigma-70 family)
VTSVGYGAPDPDVTDSDDAALIEAVVSRRSERAARRLVERHSPRLVAVVRRLLAGDASAAEDVVQQSWINGIAALPTFRHEASFATWMTRIAVRVAADHLRRPAARYDGLPDALATDLASPMTDLDQRVDLEMLIGRLPSGCRGVLVLHDIEGFTHEEIAMGLGIAVGTSKAHLFRARCLLRRWLMLDTDKEALS